MLSQAWMRGLKSAKRKKVGVIHSIKSAGKKMDELLFFIAEML